MEQNYIQIKKKEFKLYVLQRENTIFSLCNAAIHEQDIII